MSAEINSWSLNLDKNYKPLYIERKFVFEIKFCRHPVGVFLETTTNKKTEVANGSLLENGKSFPCYDYL